MGDKFKNGRRGIFEGSDSVTTCCFFVMGFHKPFILAHCYFTVNSHEESKNEQVL